MATRLRGCSDPLGMTFGLWPGSPSPSEAESRRWSCRDLTKCLVNYKVAHTGTGHKETCKPPDVFLLGSNKADVLDFARLCVIYFGFAIKKLYIYHVFGHVLLVVSRGSFFQVHINQVTFETLQVTVRMLLHIDLGQNVGRKLFF